MCRSESNRNVSQWARWGLLSDDDEYTVIFGMITGMSTAGFGTSPLGQPDDVAHALYQIRRFAATAGGVVP